MSGILIGRRLSGTVEVIDLRTPEQLANSAVAERQRMAQSTGEKPGPKPGRIRPPRPDLVMFEHPVYGMTYLAEVNANPPTPAEIAERAAGIRAGWSKREEAARREGIIGAVPVTFEPVSLGRKEGRQ